MRFFMLSDLHIGSGVPIAVIKAQLTRLCCTIRKESTPGETILFVIMGDVIHRGDASQFSDAQICLDHIRDELDKFNVAFEFVPGNHDFSDGDISAFDEFVLRYGTKGAFKEKPVYSRVYDGINFIFADSNLNRKHNLPGKLDVRAIADERKDSCKNIVFCHHGFTHDYGDSHAIIEGGEQVLRELRELHMSFVFHGHTHRADATYFADEIVEIGCGTAFCDVSDTTGLYNQFTVGCIRHGEIVSVDRYVFSTDGSAYPRGRLYPKEKTFVDPNAVGKIWYSPVPKYIQRHVLAHEAALMGSYARILSEEKELPLGDALGQHYKVLLLSDAGRGKSVELQQLAHELYDSSFFPFLYKLSNYTGQAIESLLPTQYMGLPPQYLVLAFDGYDELSSDIRERFERHLRVYVEENPDVNIVISSRSNFCKTENESKSRTFPGFTIYDLLELTRADIVGYLNNEGICADKFSAAAKAAGVEGLLCNPFYLTQITELFSKSTSLPAKAELMDKLIENSFIRDSDKFPGNLDSQYYDIMTALEQIAFAMQLMHQANLDDRKDYQYLFAPEKRLLIEHSGLFLQEGNDWRFAHNNFREYLVAKHLAKCEKDMVIEYISDGQSIKDNWVNALGYLTGFALEWSLEDWIAENAPDALVKFESDRVDPDTRYDAFIRIFTKYEEKQLWFHDALCTEEQLAAFVREARVLDFLLERISSPRHNISQYTAIRILRHYPTLYGRGDEVRACLIECCGKYPETTGQNCRMAIYALVKLRLANPATTETLVELFAACDNDDVRLGMYEYLLEVGEHNRYVEYFLHGIQYITWSYRKSEVRVGNEAIHLLHGLKALSDEASVSTALTWFSDNTDADFFERKETFETITQTAAELFRQGATDLYSVLWDCYVKFVEAYSHNEARACIEFFVTTETIERAVLTVLRQFSKNMFLLRDMFSFGDISVAVAMEAFFDGRLSEYEVFKELSIQYVRDEAKYSMCSEFFFEKTGEHLPGRVPKIDYEKRRREGRQLFFDSLFCRENAEMLLVKLLEKVGTSDVSVDDLSEVNLVGERDSAVDVLRWALWRTASAAHRNRTVRCFFSTLNLDDFLLVEYCHMLYEKSGIRVSSEQEETLKNLVEKVLGKYDPKKNILWNGDGFTLHSPYREAVYLAQYFNCELEDDVLLGLTEVPYFCFDGDNSRRKYDYLQKHIDIAKLQSRIEANLHAGELNQMILRDHIEFCDETHSDAAVGAALQSALDGACDSILRSASIDYLYNLYGAEYICVYILPSADGRLLAEIFEKYTDISKEHLRRSMERAYEKEPDVMLMSPLIALSSPIGVNAYIEWVSKNNGVPPRDGNLPDSPTRRVGEICDPEFLPALDRLTDLLFSPGFKDADFFSLRSSLMSAIANCGKSAPEETMRLLEAHSAKAEGNVTYIRFCNNIISDIERYGRGQKNLPMSREKVKELLQHWR